jgi:predicted DNA-binding protein
MKFYQTSTFGVPEYEIKAEWAYRPRISPKHSRRLWLAKQRTGKAITKIVAEALDFYLENIERG